MEKISRSELTGASFRDLKGYIADELKNTADLNESISFLNVAAFKSWLSLRKAIKMSDLYFFPYFLVSKKGKEKQALVVFEINEMPIAEGEKVSSYKREMNTGLKNVAILTFKKNGKIKVLEGDDAFITEKVIPYLCKSTLKKAKLEPFIIGAIKSFLADIPKKAMELR